MGAMQQQKQNQRVELSGIERLNLRVSNMINHPIAQLQRWVTIHRLDTDGDREWKEVMGVLSEVNEIEMAFNEDESVTLRWEGNSLRECDSFNIGHVDGFSEFEDAPF
jgi:hypothetical protein